MKEWLCFCGNSRVMDNIREALINIERRKLRSFLAMLGIGVGVFVFIVIGSMSEYFRNLSSHIRKTFEGKVFICEKMSFWAGGGIISEEKVKTVMNVPYVKDVIPILIGRIEREEMFSLGMPCVIVGLPPEKTNVYISESLLECGRWLQPCEPFDVVVGGDIAEQYDLRLNSVMKIYEKDFKVAGILKRTGTLEDRQAIMSLRSAQEVLLRPHLITCLMAIPVSVDKQDEMSMSLKKMIPWILIVTPREVEREVKRNTLYWEILTLICAVISGLASFLCVTVVMIMAVTERVREIGLKKALGADDMQIFSEYIIEVIIISISGWILGVVLGLLFIEFFRSYITDRAGLFLVTENLLLYSFLWSLFVGILSGYLSTRRSVLISPAISLRSN